MTHSKNYHANKRTTKAPTRRNRKPVSDYPCRYCLYPPFDNSKARLEHEAPCYSKDVEMTETSSLEDVATATTVTDLMDVQGIKSNDIYIARVN
ncbi:hypothetical protein G6F56_012671 [Rhizopus delemar]|nr:hypothetical protein G6F56_012671 [Rhizopus delemar]